MKLIKFLIPISLGALGGSALGLFTNYTGAIIGAILGALMLGYIEYRSQCHQSDDI